MSADEPRLAPGRAMQLRDHGLPWAPSPGDRFFLPGRGMDDEVFVLSDMTVEVHDYPHGRVIGFNGVTEWALDQVEQEEACWLPTEGQLRTMLGGLVRRLERVDAGWEALLDLPDGPRTFVGPTPADAYADAIHSLLGVLLEPSADR